jgi:hypothetical protein
VRQLKKMEYFSRYIDVWSGESQQNFWRDKLLAACYMLVYFLNYSSALKTEETWSSETSVVFHRTTRGYIPKDGTFHNHRYENLKTYKFKTHLTDVESEFVDGFYAAQDQTWWREFFNHIVRWRLKAKILALG